MNEFTCEVCEKKFPVGKHDTYGGGECIHCGQKYEYEEGWRLILNEAQIKALRSLLPNTESDIL